MPVVLVLAAAVLLIVVIWLNNQPPIPSSETIASIPSEPIAPIASSESQSTGAEYLEDDSSPFSSTSEEELTAFIEECLRDHNGMSCYIRGEGHSLLPLSLNGDRLTAMPLYENDPRRKTLKLNSIREPRVDELKPSEGNLALVRLGLKHRIPLSICYLDESGRRDEGDEELIPLREEDEFLICQSEEGDSLTKIRIQWIDGVQLPFGELDVSETQLRAFRSDLLDSGESSLRLDGLFLSESLGTDEHLATLRRLAEDPDIRAREAVADATRQHTERISKTVLRKRYTFVGPNQNPQVFALLKTLATDDAPTVRTKAAYALGDHPGEQATAILERLLSDPAEEVRRAADHAKGRLAEQAAFASAYEGAVREKASKVASAGSRKRHSRH
jgi:hypothetical protein